jgi:hypothetical protein
LTKINNNFFNLLKIQNQNSQDNAIDKLNSSIFLNSTLQETAETSDKPAPKFEECVANLRLDSKNVDIICTTENGQTKHISLGSLNNGDYSVEKAITKNGYALLKMLNKSGNIDPSAFNWPYSCKDVKVSVNKYYSDFHTVDKKNINDSKYLSNAGITISYIENGKQKTIRLVTPLKNTKQAYKPTKSLKNVDTKFYTDRDKNGSIDAISRLPNNSDSSIETNTHRELEDLAKTALNYYVNNDYNLEGLTFKSIPNNVKIVRIRSNNKLDTEKTVYTVDDKGNSHIEVPAYSNRAVFIDYEINGVAFRIEKSIPNK